MRYEIVFDPDAEADLQEIYLYLAEQAGQQIARQYVERIVDYCEEFETFPERGTRFDEISPGLRAVGFKRKATIAFRIRGSTVAILRIFHHGRNISLTDYRDDAI